jgi:hypothetical protein
MIIKIHPHRMGLFFKGAGGVAKAFGVCFVPGGGHGTGSAIVPGSVLNLSPRPAYPPCPFPRPLLPH